MEYTKNNFNSFKGIQYIKDLQDYDLSEGMVIIACPEVSRKTEKNIIKSDEVLQEETKASFNNPLFIVKTNVSHIDNIQGKRCYIHKDSTPLFSKAVKNHLDEKFLIHVLYYRDLVLVTK